MRTSFSTRWDKAHLLLPRQRGRRFEDKPKISFGDPTSMVVMRELGVRDIVTGDQHFAQVSVGFRLVPGGGNSGRKLLNASCRADMDNEKIDEILYLGAP
ncbi:hypothetical protein FJY63_12440 [Candidatus Sumerlaeota bacterium]|nr:hypothetical protein [Candidatus Sumerlaeota bacterium]